MRKCDLYVDSHVLEEVERRIPEEEFDRTVSRPYVEGEHEDTIELIRWFTRRFPTAKERLDWASRSFEEWTRPVRILGPANPEAGEAGKQA